jgi:hypothetical protein
VSEQVRRDANTQQAFARTSDIAPDRRYADLVDLETVSS